MPRRSSSPRFTGCQLRLGLSRRISSGTSGHARRHFCPLWQWRMRTQGWWLTRSRHGNWQHWRIPIRIRAIRRSIHRRSSRLRFSFPLRSSPPRRRVGIHIRTRRTDGVRRWVGRKWRTCIGSRWWSARCLSHRVILVIMFIIA